MTQDKQEPFDFNSMFDRLKTMVWKNCTECGQETHNLPEADLCLECRYNQEHPEESDMYWTWSKGGHAHLGDRCPLAQWRTPARRWGSGHGAPEGWLHLRREDPRGGGTALPLQRQGAAALHDRVRRTKTKSIRARRRNAGNHHQGVRHSRLHQHLRCGGRRRPAENLRALRD